jgi:hypothetical protein
MSHIQETEITREELKAEAESLRAMRTLNQPSSRSLTSL